MSDPIDVDVVVAGPFVRKNLKAGDIVVVHLDNGVTMPSVTVGRDGVYLISAGMLVKKDGSGARLDVAMVHEAGIH